MSDCVYLCVQMLLVFMCKLVCSDAHSVGYVFVCSGTLSVGVYICVFDVDMFEGTNLRADLK